MREAIKKERKKWSEKIKSRRRNRENGVRNIKVIFYYAVDSVRRNPFWLCGEVEIIPTT